MGWCNQFGPQIAEGCDHPMTAGPSSCSCERCGTVCTGRFGGCADVWDNGPRPVVARGPGRSDRLETPPAGDHPDGGPAAAGDLPASSGDMASDLVNGTGVSVVLAHLFERVEALETVPARMAALEDAGPGPGAGAGADTEAMAAIATQLEHLTARLAGLDAVGRRVEALEQRSVTAAPHSAAAHTGVELRSLEELAQRIVDELDQHRARTIERLDELAGSVTALGHLPERVGALEWVAEGTTAVQEALTELGRGLDRLSVETDRLSAVPERVAALERSLDRTSAVEKTVDQLGRGMDRVWDDMQRLRAVPDRIEASERTAGEAIEALERTAGEAIDALDQRLGGLEKAVADLGQGLEDLSAEVVRLGALPGRVEALERADEPVTAEALDAVHTRVEHLGERADAVEALPHRVDALERAAFGGGPVHHRSRSIVADLDALGSQVEVVATAVDGVPRRLADVERSTARTEALERGLAGAIDMIDQLVVQLGALEWACRPLPPPEDHE